MLWSSAFAQYDPAKFLLPDWSLDGYKSAYNTVRIKPNGFSEDVNVREELTLDSGRFTLQIDSNFSKHQYRGSYVWSRDTLLLMGGRYDLSLKKKGRGLTYLNGAHRLRPFNPTRLRASVSYQYGPEVYLLLPYYPFKVSLDVFPIRGVNVFLGADGSVKTPFFTFWTHAGVHIGYQYRFLLLQADLDMLYVAIPLITQFWQPMFTPKLGVVYHNVFIKAGPSFAAGASNALVKGAPRGWFYTRMDDHPLNFELGYYFRFDR